MVYSGEQLIVEYDLSTGALTKEYVYGGKGLIATVSQVQARDNPGWNEVPP
jgi:hypothetical protein